MSNDDQQYTPGLSTRDGVNPPNKEGWERDTLEKLAFATLKEQRARRRWNIFFRFATLAIVIFVVAMSFNIVGQDAESVGMHTALIEIDGTIESDSVAAASAVIPALNRAYEDSMSAGVILHINSPGGSPVQAGMIADEIFRLRKAYPKKPLYVVVSEMCASGGYYIAAAADKIYVNKASIIGSIGVMMNGFGFTGLMDKLGVERRLMTAGENKAIMDPFSPQTASQTEYAQSMLNEIHQQFIDVVKAGRGTRLKDAPEIFSGLFWTGSKAVELGLADGFGTVESVARNDVKAEKVVDYTQHEGLSERVLKKFGAAAGAGAMSSIWNSTPAKLK